MENTEHKRKQMTSRLKRPFTLTDARFKKFWALIAEEVDLALLENADSCGCSCQQNVYKLKSKKKKKKNESFEWSRRGSVDVFRGISGEQTVDCRDTGRRSPQCGPWNLTDQRQIHMLSPTKK